MNKLKTLISLSLLTIAAPLLAAEDEVACTMQYDPVCGVDGLTYSNECVAGAAGVEVASTGMCPDASNSCGEEYDPVCGIDGTTYINVVLLCRPTLRSPAWAPAPSMVVRVSKTPCAA